MGSVDERVVRRVAAAAERRRPAVPVMRRALRRTGLAAVLSALLLVTVPPAAIGAPRLSEDGSALVLQEEAGGQPAVVFSMDRQTGRREIRLIGGAQILPTIGLRCPGGQRTIGLAVY